MIEALISGKLVGAPEQVIGTLSDAAWESADEKQVDAALLLGNAFSYQRCV